MKKIISLMLCFLIFLSLPMAESFAIQENEIDWKNAYGEDYDGEFGIIRSRTCYAEEDGVLYECFLTLKDKSKTPSYAVACMILGKKQSDIVIKDEVYFPYINQSVKIRSVGNIEAGGSSYNATGFDFNKLVSKKSVKTIHISDSVKNVYDINGYKNLKNIYIGKNVKSIFNCFDKCPNVNPIINKDNKYLIRKDSRILSKDGKTQYYDLKPTKTYKIKKGVKNVNLAFNDNSAVEKIVVSYNLNYIRGDDKLKNLKTVTFKNNISVKKIEFYGCKKLNKVTLSNKQKLSGFYCESNIKSIKLPKSIKTVDKLALSYCKSLSKVTVESKTKAPKISKKAFLGAKSGIKFYTKNKKVAKQLKNNLKDSGVKKAKIYVGKKLIYKNVK